MMPYGWIFKREDDNGTGLDEVDSLLDPQQYRFALTTKSKSMYEMLHPIQTTRIGIELRGQRKGHGREQKAVHESPSLIDAIRLLYNAISLCDVRKQIDANPLTLPYR
jgi:hypothetical protein